MSTDKASDPPSASASLSTADFLGFLQAEIDSIMEAQREPGWTVWALLLALAGLAWLASEELTRHYFSVDTVARLFVVAASTICCFETLASPFFTRSDYGPFERSRFDRAPYLYGHFGPRVAAAALYCVLLASLAWYFKANTPRFYVHLAVWTFGGIALLALTVFPLASSGLTIERSNKPTYQYLSAILVSGLLPLAFGLIAVGFLTSLVESSGWPKIIEVRLSIMLAVAASLLTYLLNYNTPPPLLKTLITIRRELGLGRISLDEAIRKADIAFLGLRATDVLQEEVKSVLELLAFMNREVREGIEALEFISTRLPVADDQVGPKDKASLKLFLGVAKAHLKSALEKESETRKKLERLKKRIEWAVLRVPDRPGETVNAIVKMFEEPKGEWFQRLEEFTAKYEGLRRRAESLGVVLDS